MRNSERTTIWVNILMRWLFSKKQWVFFELYQVSTFRMYRKPKGGGAQELIVEVWDAGP